MLKNLILLLFVGSPQWSVICNKHTSLEVEQCRKKLLSTWELQDTKDWDDWKIIVIIHEDTIHFAEATKFGNPGLSKSEPNRKTIYIHLRKDFPNYWENVLPHELAHAMLAIYKIKLKEMSEEEAFCGLSETQESIIVRQSHYQAYVMGLKSLDQHVVVAMHMNKFIRMGKKATWEHIRTR